MKLQKSEKHRTIPAVIVYNVQEDCEDAQPEIFMREEAMDDPTRGHVLAGNRNFQIPVVEQLNSMAVA